jgi:ribosomal protein L37AE/L43A
MVNAKQVERFVCPKCKEEHESRGDATECCAPIVEDRKLYWECMECGELFVDKDKADKCCE